MKLCTNSQCLIHQGTYSMFIPFMLALRALPLSRKKTPVQMGHNWRIHEGRVTCDMWIPSTESLPYGGRAGLDRPFSPALLNSNPAACALLISRLPQDENTSWAAKKFLLAPKHFLCFLLWTNRSYPLSLCCGHGKLHLLKGREARAKPGQLWWQAVSWSPSLGEPSKGSSSFGCSV